MTRQRSFTKIENNLLPEFRQKIASAESINDVKNNLIYTIQDLIFQASAGTILLDAEDISLVPDHQPPVFLSDRVTNRDDFATVWDNSDLPQVVGRLSGSAINRYKHLEKKTVKTKSKIRN